MNCFDGGISGEILFVKGQNPLDAVHCHRGYQSCVVNLNARDIARDQQFPPLLVNGRTIRKQPQPVFKQARPTVRFPGRKPVSVAVNWPSASIPELGYILRRIAKYRSLSENGVNC